jgi:hypothetical protein
LLKTQDINREIGAHIIMQKDFLVIDGDKLANNIITELVNFLSIAIINLILIQNPQLIAIV